MQIGSTVVDLIRSGRIKHIQVKDSDGNVFIYDVDPKFASECGETENCRCQVKVILPRFKEKEKPYLKSILDKYNDRINYVVKRKSVDNQCNIFFGLDHGKNIVALQVSDDMFDQMILDRKYAPSVIRDQLKRVI